MTTYVIINEEDPAFDLASLLDSLDAKAGEASEYHSFAKEERYDELICSGLLLGEKVYDVSAEETESLFSLFFLLLNRIEENAMESTVSSLCDFLSDLAVAQHPKLRLALLTNLFNCLDAKLFPRERQYALKAVLSYATATKQSHLLAGQITSELVDSWLACWSFLSADELLELRQSLAELYRAAASAQPNNAHLQQQSSQFSLQYLKSVPASNKKALSASAKAAADLVVEVIRNSASRSIEEIVNLPAVQNLASVAQYASLHQLLLLVSSGSLSDFNSFYSANKATIDQYGFVDLPRKFRSLTLCSLAATSSRLDFDAVRSHLQLDSDEAVEDAVVDAVSDGLIDAKLDEKSRSVIVERSSRRVFTSQDWQGLLDKLESWKTNLQVAATQFNESILNNRLPAMS